MRYCALKPPTAMRDLPSFTSFFAIAMGIGMLTIATIVDTKPATKDTASYYKCVQLHPERYCGITYLGKQ